MTCPVPVPASPSDSFPQQPPRSIKLRPDKAARKLWTLRELFERKFWPYQLRECHAEPRNRETYLELLKHWESLTPNPSLVQINKRSLARFKRRLEQQPGRRGETLSPRTVHKHLRSLRALVGFAGRSSDKRPDAIGILKKLPRMRLPSPGKPKAQRVTTLAEVKAMLAVTPRFKLPEGRRGGKLPVRKVYFWQALLVFDQIAGYRVGTLLELEWVHLEGNRLTVDESLDKCEQADCKVLPDFLMALLDKIRPADPQPGDKIFPWPHGMRHLWTCLDKLQELAGIPKERRRWMKFHGLRKRASAEAAKLGGVQAAQLICGHTDGSTTLESYIPREELTEHIMAQMPAPELPTNHGQRWLFE
jgi:hypothetical protein